MAIRVLVVDDNDTIRGMLCDRISAVDGLEVAADAARGVEALAVIDGGEVEVDVAVVDYEMPGMSGLATAEAIVRGHPDLPVVLCTGTPSPALWSAAAAVGAAGCVDKLEIATLPDTLRAVTGELTVEPDPGPDAGGPSEI